MLPPMRAAGADGHDVAFATSGSFADALADVPLLDVDRVRRTCREVIQRDGAVLAIGPGDMTGQVGPDRSGALAAACSLRADLRVGHSFDYLAPMVARLLEGATGVVSVGGAGTALVSLSRGIPPGPDADPLSSTAGRRTGGRSWRRSRRGLVRERRGRRDRTCSGPPATGSRRNGQRAGSRRCRCPLRLGGAGRPDRGPPGGCTLNPAPTSCDWLVPSPLHNPSNLRRLGLAAICAHVR